jgi:hypothetical protein
VNPIPIDSGDPHPLPLPTVPVNPIPVDSGDPHPLPPIVVDTPATGYLDLADSTTVSGWASDVDVNGPISVLIVIDGTETTVLANQARSDVGNHAFSFTHPAFAPGTHTISAFALNVTPAGFVTGPVLLVNGSTTVVVTDHPPTGHLDAADNSIVGGWASDPDTTGPVDVVIEVDGVQTRITADQSRTDVGLHAFQWNHPAFTPGVHTINAYAANWIPGEGSADGLVLLPGGPLTVVTQPPVTGRQATVIVYAVAPGQTGSWWCQTHFGGNLGGTWKCTDTNCNQDATLYQQVSCLEYADVETVTTYAQAPGETGQWWCTAHFGGNLGGTWDCLGATGLFGEALSCNNDVSIGTHVKCGRE